MKIRIIFLFILLFNYFSPISSKEIPITVEHAITQKELQWGLMKRESLPENHGMLFHYPHTHYPSLWMFNCGMDLSVAFLDEEQIIREIQEMRCYSFCMDPHRPVNKVEDFALYPSNDPVIHFFAKRSIRSSVPAKFSLEMEAHWFERNEVRVGDRVEWDQSGNARIVHRAKP